MKRVADVLFIIVAILIVGVLGCRCLMDEVTPAKINDRTIKYAEVDKGIIGFPSLADVKRLKTEIVINHRDKQIDLKRIAQDDKLAYQDALNFIDASIAEAEYVQSLVIGDENNPFSILGLLAPLGIGTALGRRYFKRPGDLSPEEAKALKNS